MCLRRLQSSLYNCIYVFCLKKGNSCWGMFFWRNCTDYPDGAFTYINLQYTHCVRGNLIKFRRSLWGGCALEWRNFPIFSEFSEKEHSPSSKPPPTSFFGGGQCVESTLHGWKTTVLYNPNTSSMTGHRQERYQGRFFWVILPEGWASQR